MTVPSPPSGASGRARPQRLEEAGIRTVVELARADHEDLARRFGPAIGPHLRILGLGGDDSPVVDTPFVPRSRSKEETFTHDVVDPVEIADHVRRLAVDVTESVVAEGRRVTHVAVKVRTATFFTRTKISKLPEPTTDPAVVAQVASTVLGRFDDRSTGPAARRAGDARTAVMTTGCGLRRSVGGDVGQRRRAAIAPLAQDGRGALPGIARRRVDLDVGAGGATDGARRGRRPRHRRTGRGAGARGGA